ncbi:MAG TPA: endolytic transglycosylase MltG [Jatrophihabitans sp.]|uniref:endolytic transglycosylase MltG n=1 Tax=Jatrophihabitans sp. TaxID=1932789 RepID=UPI002EE91636
MEGSIDELRDDDHPLFDSDDGASHVPGARKRAQRRQRRRRRHRLAPIIAIVLILGLIAVSYQIVSSVSKRFVTPDYSGSGQGFTRVKVSPGDGATDVAAAMVKAGVVKSSRAFINAAENSGRASDIQAGVYKVRLRSSGEAAMAAILDPANRLVSQVTIPEGYTERQVLTLLASKTGLPIAELRAAAGKISNLGLPEGMSPKTAEGFLFPSTYEFDPDQSADEVVQQLAGQFAAEYRKLGFAAGAKALKLTPYQALIIASLIESEAKFPEDRPKVARVILNRMAKGTPIGIDAANRYGVALTGKDPDSVTYTEDSPYNVRTRVGLPPTPVSNPGEASLQAAIQPAAGDWIYYVVSDSAGHHVFTADEDVFTAAVAKCKANGWGC